MNYYFSKKLNTNFEDALTRVTEELKKEGFGILTEIDAALNWLNWGQTYNIHFRNFTYY